MAAEKKNMGPEEPIVPEAPSPDIPGAPPAPSVTEQAVEQGTIPGMEEVPDPSTTVINLAAARVAAKQAEQPAPEAEVPDAGRSGPVPPGELVGPDDREPWEKTSNELEAEQKKPRRGRPPKAEKADQSAPGAAELRKGRPSMADKAAPDGATPPKRDKMGLLTKSPIQDAHRPVGRKKGAQWRQLKCFIIRLRFSAVIERRQWSSAAFNPRRKTRVKLCPHFRAAKVPSHQICRLRRAFR